MKFTKMHGIGNDYVYVNCFSEKIEDEKELAISVSKYHFGVGSDGLILIKPSDIADFRMDMYNADGSRSEMCGNGIRCVGKYVYDYNLTDKTEISVETLAGIKYLKLSVKEGKVNEITVNMGAPVLEPKLVPVNLHGNSVIDREIEIDDNKYNITCVSMGNPHAVVFVDNTENIDINKIGPEFEFNPLFPARVNAEFVEVIDRKNVKMRVWERGTGETMACGTGACAVCVACVLNDKTDDEVNIELLGGNLKIKWDRENNLVFMTGPAETVFDGELL